MAPIRHIVAPLIPRLHLGLVSILQHATSLWPPKSPRRHHSTLLAFVPFVFSLARPEVTCCATGSAYALMQARKIIRGLKEGLTEDERYAVADHVISQLKERGDPWAKRGSEVGRRSHHARHGAALGLAPKSQSLCASSALFAFRLMPGVRESKAFVVNQQRHACSKLILGATGSRRVLKASHQIDSDSTYDSFLENGVKHQGNRGRNIGQALSWNMKGRIFINGKVQWLLRADIRRATDQQVVVIGFYSEPSVDFEVLRPRLTCVSDVQVDMYFPITVNSYCGSRLMGNYQISSELGASCIVGNNCGASGVLGCPREGFCSAISAPHDLQLFVENTSLNEGSAQRGNTSERNW